MAFAAGPCCLSPRSWRVRGAAMPQIESSLSEQTQIWPLFLIDTLLTLRSAKRICRKSGIQIPVARCVLLASDDHRGTNMLSTVDPVFHCPRRATFKTSSLRRAYRHWAALVIIAYLMIGCASEVDSDAGSDTEYPNPCDKVHCDTPRTCVAYYGVLGTNGPQFTECVLPCMDDPNVCPEGTTCTTIYDGPGTVCF